MSLDVTTLAIAKSYTDQHSGSGSDPIVENAKQTGGFGYTEQGEQTVITWDGYPEGLPSAFGSRMFKVSDKTPTKEELASARFIHNEKEHEINEETDITVGVNCLMVHYSGNETYYRIFVAYKNGVMFDAETIEEAGTYFVNTRSLGTVTSLTYGTPDTIHKIDEKYLQSNVQPDWNQNDETAADYVKNRPFYTGDPAETVLVEDINVSFSNPRENIYYGSIPTTIELIARDTYKVSWDGATYECVCGLIMGNPAIGNPSIMGAGADTGEPFLILPLADNQGTEVYTLDISTSHTISISGVAAQVTKIDEKYLPELPYMDKVNPAGTGSFSLNRKADTDIGEYSFAEGCDTIANTAYSHAEGFQTTASGECSHAEGNDTTASGNFSHAEGYQTTASGDCSHAEGIDTTAASEYQHVQGKFNIPDNAKAYAHIVGNGVLGSRSNAHTLDWSGNAWFAGTVEGKALILPSSTEGSTKKFRITVDDSGTISATEVTST